MSFTVVPFLTTGICVSGGHTLTFRSNSLRSWSLLTYIHSTVCYRGYSIGQGAARTRSRGTMLSRAGGSLVDPIVLSRVWGYASGTFRWSCPIDRSRKGESKGLKNTTLWYCDTTSTFPSWCSDDDVSWLWAVKRSERSGTVSVRHSGTATRVAMVSTS